jgi:signal-transduction protein with cAMP-binding, CBS, and nucleotidyltransferase domain
MICPHCGQDNLPGSEDCSHCLMDLTQLDQPQANSRVERSLMEDAVGRLCPHLPFTVLPSTTIKETIRSMLDHKIGALLVVDSSGSLLGIFSERDLLTRVIDLHENYEQLPVERFMTSKPETVTAEDTLAFALHKMDVGGYRHLPVLKGGRPVGVISARDMLRHITRMCLDA